MPPLPVVSGGEAVRAFERAGFHVTRQSGSHIIMVKTGFENTLAVPNHRELKTGTLRGLLRTAKLSVNQFVELL